MQNTSDFVNKLQKLGPIPDNTLLVTMGVSSLYTNISNKVGLIALKEAPDSRHIREPTSELITTLMNHILVLNNFTFNGTNYLQIKGCAIGTVAAPSYATTFWVALKKYSSIQIF